MPEKYKAALEKVGEIRMTDYLSGDESAAEKLYCALVDLISSYEYLDEELESAEDRYTNDLNELRSYIREEHRYDYY